MSIIYMLAVHIFIPVSDSTVQILNYLDCRIFSPLPQNRKKLG